MRLLLIALLSSTASFASAAQNDLDQITAERDSLVAAAEASYAEIMGQAQSELDQATERANAKAVTALERVAKRSARSGDMTTGASAWKSVLRYDREHVEARGFFDAIGQLDRVLADLEQADAAPDLIGGPEAQLAATTPGTLAVLASLGHSQIRDLSEGTDAIGGLPTPITRVPEELAGASFIQPPLLGAQPIRVRCFQGGSVAVVAGPGYSGLQQVTDAGFAPAEFTLGVSQLDQKVFIKELPRDEELELPAGPLMVIAAKIRSLPATAER